MMFNGWFFVVVVWLVHLPSVSNDKYSWSYRVDHTIILGAAFDNSTVAAFDKSAEPFFKKSHSWYNPQYLVDEYNKKARVALLARNEAVDEWRLFTNGFSNDTATFRAALAKVPRSHSTQKKIDLTKPLKMVLQLYNSSSDMDYKKNFKIVHLLITGNDPISSETEAQAKHLRDGEDVWLYVFSTSGQCSECSKLTGSEYPERIMPAPNITDEFEKLENTFGKKVCNLVVGHRYMNEKQDACVKAEWTPLKGIRDYYCGGADPPLGLSLIEECKRTCDKWWPMEEECTCGKKVSRLRGRIRPRSTFLDTCDNPVDCGPCPPKQAALPGWAIGSIVVVAIAGVVGGVVGARLVVRRQRMNRAVMAVKKEAGGATAAVGGGGTVVQEKEEFKYEFTFQGKSGMVTIEDKSAVGKGKSSTGKSAKSPSAEVAKSAPKGKKSMKK